MTTSNRRPEVGGGGGPNEGEGSDESVTATAEEHVRMDDGARLATWTTGRASSASTAVLLLHGGPGLWDYLTPLADLVEGAVVHRFDQRGCGRSSPSADLTTARYLADIEQLRRHWSHERFVLVGHSFGAALALAYAGTHPNRAAAVVYLSGVGIGDWRTPFRAEVARRRAALGIEPRLGELGARRRPAEEVEWRRLVWATDYADPAAGLEASRAMAETSLAINHEADRRLAFGDDDQLRWAAALACPVSVVHGSADPRPAACARALADRIPGASFHLVDGAGHLPWVERPGEIRRLLGDALRAVRP